MDQTVSCGIKLEDLAIYKVAMEIGDIVYEAFHWSIFW